MTQTWHADEQTLKAWADGSAAPVLAASLEAHLLRCEECRRRTATLATGTTASDSVRRWSDLADIIDRPRTNPLTRVGLSTPGLRAAWLGAFLVMLTVPAVAATMDARIPLMLTLAPLAPLAAVAVAYGRAAEPAGEIALAVPSAGLRVVAARSLVVALPALPVGVGAALAFGLPLEVALGWLLPGAALAAVVLLTGTTKFDPATVAAVLGSIWAVAVASPSAVRRLPADVVADVLVSSPAQLTALAVAAAATALTIARRDDVAYRRTA